MDDLLREFLTETNENLSRLDTELVRLEKHADDPALIGSIFRMVHTIKGTCGFFRFAASSTCAPEVGEKLVGFTTRIYEACNVQDITGQRIAKVIGALKHIDAKVEGLIKALDLGASEPAARAGDEKPSLLNGPQLPRNAMDQTSVDRLWAEQGKL